MSILKRGMICFSIILCCVTLSACSKKAVEGTKEKPAGVGQTMYYDGTEAKKKKNRFKAEITLEDVVRGEEAQDIFAAAGGYAGYHEALDLDEEEELMVARFTFALTDVQDNGEIDIGERDVHMFSLVSKGGTEYDYFPQRRYVGGNLFENAKEGTTQTGAMFYIVDKDDKSPDIVFMPDIGEGIWFKTNLGKSDKEKVERPLLAADWLDADGKTPVYAGTLNTPLPIGEFGYMKCRSSYFGDYELEVKVDDVLRGDEAEEQLYDLKIYGLEEHKLLDSQEYLMINVTANVPSAHLLDEDLLIIDSMDFGVVNSKSGKDYDFDNILFMSPHDLCAIAPGGTATGWIGVIIDKADSSPMMYYQSLDDKMLYFKLDKAYDVPDGYSSYQPGPVFAENPIRDAKQKKGDWRNPYKTGETVKVKYDPRYIEDKSSPFTCSFCVQEAYRGETAKKLVDSYYRPYQDRELIVLKIAVSDVEAEGNEAPRFDGNSYTILNGQGGQAEARGLSADELKIDGIEDVYPGGNAEGYVAFLIPKGNDNLVLTYGDPYSGLDNEAWIRLEFSDSIPKDVAEQLKGGDGQPDLEKDKDSSDKQVLTAKFDDTDNLEVICIAVGEGGRIQTLNTQWTLKFGKGVTADYNELLEQYKLLITELENKGIDIELESDEEHRTITIREGNVYGEEGPYEIGYMMQLAGIPLSGILDENGAPSMDALETTLRSFGFLVY